MELMQLFEKVELRLLAVIIDAQFMCHLNFDILFKLQVETNILIYYMYTMLCYIWDMFVSGAQILCIYTSAYVVYI